ncbi:protein of unknown function [Streptomyces murinus]
MRPSSHQAPSKRLAALPQGRIRLVPLHRAIRCRLRARLGGDSVRVRVGMVCCDHPRDVRYDDALVVRVGGTLPEAVAQVRSRHPAPVDASHRRSAV